MGEIIRLYEKNTDIRQLRNIADQLERGAIIIYPTDTTYAMGCSLDSVKSINRLKKLKGIDNDNLALICGGLSNIADYARVDDNTFKVLKRNTPGAVTFILNASNSVPNSFLNNKKTVAIRIPENNITLSLVEMLGVPLVSTSIPPDEEWEEMNDPSLIWEKYRGEVDIMIDGGSFPPRESTIVDFTDGEPEIIREGAVEVIL